MNAQEIGNAFKDEIDDFATARNLPVAWPNVDFTPDALPYLDVQFAPAPNDRLTLKSRTKTYGSLIITVVGAKGVGSAASEGLADEIADKFAVDYTIKTLTNRLRITVAPSIREGLRDGPHWRVPVVIPYEMLI